MSKTYFIDSENVGDNWISLLNVVTEEDVILVFYTNRSPHMNYKNVILLKQSPVEVTFIECCEGNNALDFQLCTDLGYRMHELGDNDEFIIVSNDTGFDAVVKYWRRRTKPIKRIQGKVCAQIAAEKKEERFVLPQETENSDVENTAEESLTAENTATENSDAAQPEKTLEDKVEEQEKKQEEVTKEEKIDENAKEILYLIGKSNLQELHEALKQLYGGEKGKFIYNTFKSDTAYNSFISSHAPMSLKEKQKLYCSIVFSVSAGAETMPEDFPSYLVNAWSKKKNLNSLKSLLLQQYGKEKSNKYYSLFKVHIKILDKIK